MLLHLILDVETLSNFHFRKIMLCQLKAKQTGTIFSYPVSTHSKPSGKQIPVPCTGLLGGAWRLCEHWLQRPRRISSWTCYPRKYARAQRCLGLRDVLAKSSTLTFDIGPWSYFLFCFVLFFVIKTMVNNALTFKFCAMGTDSLFSECLQSIQQR